MLRLDPSLALFRSGPNQITIGAQHPAITIEDDPQSVAALAVLTRGVLEREFHQLFDAPFAAEFLQLVGPALLTSEARTTVRVRGRVALARTMQRAARRAGHEAGSGLIIPVSPWRLPEPEVERLVAENRPHLPVLLGDAWIQIGPYLPDGGCQRCVDAHDGSIAPAALVPLPTEVARWQSVGSILTALRLHSMGTLSAGWGVRIAQASGAVSALPSTEPCPCRSRVRSAKAA